MKDADENKDFTSAEKTQLSDGSNQDQNDQRCEIMDCVAKEMALVVIHMNTSSCTKKEPHRYKTKTQPSFSRHEGGGPSDRKLPTSQRDEAGPILTASWGAAAHSRRAGPEEQASCISWPSDPTV